MTERERIIAGFSPAEREIYKSLTGKELPHLDQLCVAAPTPFMDAAIPEKRKPRPIRLERRYDHTKATGPTPKPVEDADTGEWWESARAAAETLHIPWGTIKNVLVGKLKHCRGRRFRYSQHKTRPALAPAA